MWIASTIRLLDSDYSMVVEFLGECHRDVCGTNEMLFVFISSMEGIGTDILSKTKMVGLTTDGENATVILVASMSISHQPKLMHLAEARLFTKFLAGASLLMSFHLGGHCRPGYDVTHSSFLAGCTRHLPGILAYHYHAHHPAAWTKISE